MTLYAEGHQERKAAMLGLYAQLKNIEFQLGALRKDVNQLEIKIKDLLAALIKADSDLEQFK